MPPRRRRPRTALLAAATLAVMGGRALGAQVLKLPARSPEPEGWAALDVGYTQLGAVLDGRTGTAWRFGDGVQYRASLEYAVARGTSVGLSATWARMPLRYEPLDRTTPAGPAARSVDAHADLTTLAASLHAGGGTPGFHPVVEASVGTTIYAHFRDDATKAKLPPRSDADFSFSVGTGFGYSTSERNELFIVQEWSNAFHQRTGLSNSTRANARQATRLGARVGLGKRRVR